MSPWKTLVLFALLLSCSRAERHHNKVASEVTIKTTKPDKQADIKIVTSSDAGTGQSPGAKVQLLLRFDDLTLTTAFDEVWNEKDYFKKIHHDTILVQLGLASKFSGQTYKMKQAESVTRIQVYQNYETSLTIMDEGPHVDLTDWIHFVGEWRELDIRNNRFNTLEYQSSDTEKFPPVTPGQILEATRRHSDTDSSRWTDLARECTGPNTYPCGVSISRINLKIILTHKEGVKKEKFIIFEIPMGC